MSEIVPTNIEELFIDQLNISSFDIIQKIDDDLEKFLKLIIEDDSEYVLICGRKSNLLYSKYVSDITSSDKIVLNIETLEDATTMGFLGPGKTLLLSDSIHNGNEFNKICSFILDIIGLGGLKNIKAYTYVGFVNGLNLIKDKGIECYAHHYYEDQKRYYNNMKNLDVYFQSKYEHLETDLPYDRYNIPISDVYFIDLIITDCIEKILCSKIKIQKDNLHTMENIIQYSFMCLYDPSSCKCLDDIYIINNLKDIDEIVLRFVVKIYTDSRKIIMTVKSDSLLNFSTYGIHKKITPNCRLNYIEHKECSQLRVRFDKRMKRVKQIICSTCVGNSISELILNKFREIVIEQFEENEIQYDITRMSNRIIV